MFDRLDMHFTRTNRILRDNEEKAANRGLMMGCVCVSDNSYDTMVFNAIICT